MNEIPDSLVKLALEVADFEEKLQALELELEEIGQPAAAELEKRLEALKIEERALNRNLEEALGKTEPDPAKMKKAEALLDYIRREEASVKREADFLNRANPSSVEVAARTASRVASLCHNAFKRIIGNHHPLGESVFVNHTGKNLEEFYGHKPAKKD